jgi:hypothetical protein
MPEKEKKKKKKAKAASQISDPEAMGGGVSDLQPVQEFQQFLLRNDS